MRYEVEMLALAAGKIRTVTIPDEMVAVSTQPLELIFYHGQNGFALPEDIEQCLPSVSVGDVIRLPDPITTARIRRYRVDRVGFTELD